MLKLPQCNTNPPEEGQNIVWGHSNSLSSFIYTHTHTHTHTHAHTHTHTSFIHTHTHTQTYTCMLVLAQALTGVDTDVARQASFGSKGHPAAFTHIGPVPCVSPHVTLSTENLGLTSLTCKTCDPVNRKRT